jgi:hypothetical protein
MKGSTHPRSKIWSAPVRKKEAPSSVKGACSGHELLFPFECMIRNGSFRTSTGMFTTFEQIYYEEKCTRLPFQCVSCQCGSESYLLATPIIEMLERVCGAVLVLTEK